MHLRQRCRLRMRVALEDFFDDVTDVTVAHVRLTQRLLVHLGELTDRVADHGVPQVQFPLVAVRERPGREVDGRQRQGLLVEAGEVVTKQPRLLQLAAGRANRFARPGECLHAASLEG